MVANAITQFERFLDPVTELLTPEAARALVDFRFDAATVERINELAEKSRTGTLSDEERGEYARIIEIGDLIGSVKARARGFLRRQANR
jgi:hypothetical protein